MTHDPNPLNVDLAAEVERLKTAIIRHRDYRGDDRCQLDDAELYATVGDVPAGTGELPPREVWLAGCLKFWECRKAGVAYESAERLEVERLNLQNRQLRQQVNGLHDELAAAERQRQAAPHHAETEADLAPINRALTDYGKLIDENERLKAERDYCQRYYHNVVVEAKRLKSERDEARAQAARLAEALEAVIPHMQNYADQMGEIASKQPIFSEFRFRNAGASTALHNVANAIGSTIVGPVLASTDSRTWLDEQIAEELKRFLDEFDDLPIESLEIQYVKERIAELRRKEGA